MGIAFCKVVQCNEHFLRKGESLGLWHQALLLPPLLPSYIIHY